ncbi:MAG: hypothetical protein JSW28_06505, partial [Thermoplasmata archaeon]
KEKAVVEVNINSPDILRGEMKKVRRHPVCVWGYQPIEREYRLIRKALKLLYSKGFPVHIETKSNVILDDLDLLNKISSKSSCAVSFRINTLDANVTEIFETGTALPDVRMSTLGRVAEEGITTGLVLKPIIPHVTDSEEAMEGLVKEAQRKGARYVIAEPLRLEDECRIEVIDLIKRHYPELLVKYKRIYEFGAAPESRYVRMLRARMRRVAKRYGLEEELPYKRNKRGAKQIKIEQY